MRLIIITIFLFISFNTSLKANLDDNLQSILKEGGKLIFIRHAYAPGGGDPDGFNLLNCSTQRNLNNDGIEQSKRIGQIFLKNGLIINKVLSSEWCRCKQTAKYAFTNYETKSFLNSFFSQEFSHNKNNQIKELKKYVKMWDGKNNLIFVTHYVVISEVLKLSVSSGEIVVTDKEFNILARKKTYNN
jgi:phosphohistidine phosphatase SixA